MKKYAIRTITLAVITVNTLTLMACGKSKNESAPVVAADVAPAPPVKTPEQLAAEKAEQEKRDKEASQVPPPAESAEDSKDAGTVKPDDNTQEKPEDPDDQSKAPPAEPPNKLQNGPLPLQLETEEEKQEQKDESKASNSKLDHKIVLGPDIVCGKEGLSDEQIEELNKLKVLARHYTGAGNDNLRELLIEKAKTLCTLRDLRAANKIQEVYLDFNYPQPQFELTMKVRTDKGIVKVVKAYGTLMEDRRANFKAVGAQNTTGIEIEGSLQCMDVETNKQGLLGCVTAVVSLRMGPKEDQAFVDVIVRKAALESSAVFAAQPNGRTQAEIEFRDFLGNPSVYKYDYISKSQFETYEVINGRSGFKGKLVSNKGEILVIAGDLTGYISAVRIGRSAMMAEDYIYRGVPKQVSFYADRLIKNAVLTHNDQAGVITVRLGLPNAVGEDFVDWTMFGIGKGVSELQID